MSTFDRLYRAISNAVASGRVGTPVFVRCAAHAFAERADLDVGLSRTLGATAGWLGVAPHRVFALGDAGSGQITVTLESERGRTAIVSVGLAFDRTPLVDLLLLGSRGAIRHEGIATLMIEEMGAWGSLPEAPAEVMDAVRRSLSTGQVETLTD